MMKKLRAHLVADVGDALDACLDCGVLSCRAGRWQDCPHRLARAARLRRLFAAPGSAGGSDSAPFSARDCMHAPAADDAG